MFLEFAAYTIMSVMSITSPAPTDIKLITPLPKNSPSPIPTYTPIPTKTPTPFPTATPTLTPTLIPPAPLAPSDLDGLFTKYSQLYNTDSDLLKRIAKCESGFNSQAENGPYVGMFQFASQTWNAVRNRMGENPDETLRKNAEEAIKTASFAISQGGQNAWANCL